MREVQADAVVIGAGAGGLCAAARLVHRGLRPIVVEARDKLGGRATTNIIDGFVVNEGAIALEVGGVFEETFNLVGAPLDLRFPEPASAFYLDHKVVDVGKGGWGLLLGQMTKQAARIMARAFLTYFVSKGAFKRFGFCPQGTIGVWQALADAVAKHGEVWLSSPAQSIEIEDGAVRAVIVRRGDETIRVVSDCVVSNAGPKGTLALAGANAFSADYVRRVADLRPAANIVYNFASREPLVSAPGIVTFGRTRRLCNMATMTAACPELAPPGWHLYVAYAVPKPALGDFDSEAEKALGLEDLREQFPGFDRKAKMLSIRVMRDDWPAQRACAGYDLQRETEVRGLWQVGDAVKDYGNGGTQACAETARLVVDAIMAERAAPARQAAR